MCHETGAHVPKPVFYERDVCQSQCFMRETCQSQCFMRVCARVCLMWQTYESNRLHGMRRTRAKQCFMREMCAKANVSWERHVPKPVLHERVCARVCLIWQTYESNRLRGTRKTHVPNSVPWGRHMCQTCMSSDKWTCAKGNEIYMSKGWETNIYGHETEVHLPKPICCKR
jgi:hypothetical protein